jgi:hypothetical protein
MHGTAAGRAFRTEKKNLREKANLEHLGVDLRVILKRLL